MLNSKNTCSDCAKTPDPSISSGLYVKNKTIRVLLDSGSSGDLLFMKKGSSKRISIVKQVVPQSWGTSNGTFVTNKVGNIEISFVEYSASKKVCLQPDIVEYSLGDQAPMYDLIIGKQTMHDLGMKLDFQEKTIIIIISQRITPLNYLMYSNSRCRHEAFYHCHAICIGTARLLNF
jgi:hypothetical protein